jgi:hypothetical protein
MSLSVLESAIPRLGSSRVFPLRQAGSEVVGTQFLTPPQPAPHGSSGSSGISAVCPASSWKQSERNWMRPFRTKLWHRLLGS